MGKIKVAVSKTFMGHDVVYSSGGFTLEDERALNLKFKLSEGQFLYAVSFQKGGIFFRVSTPVGGGRAGDNYTAAFFIPARTGLSGQEIDEVVRTLKEVLTAYVKTNRIDTATLSALADTEYSHPAPVYPDSKADGSVALRRFGKNTDNTTFARLAKKLCLPEYLKFATVVFVDNADGVEITDSVGNGQSVTVLDDNNIQPACQDLLRVSGERLSECRIWVGGQQYGGAPLLINTPLVNVKIERPGFEPYEIKDAVIGESGVLEIPAIVWKRRITEANFTVVNRSNSPLSGCEIKLNDKPLPVIVPETVPEVTVTISRSGYKDIVRKHSVEDIVNGIQAIMTEEMIESVFVVSSRDIKWPGQTEVVNRRPAFERDLLREGFTGYVKKGGNLVARKMVKMSILWIIVAAELVLAAGAGVAAGYFLWGRPKAEVAVEQSEEQTSQQTAEQTSDQTEQQPEKEPVKQSETQTQNKVEDKTVEKSDDKQTEKEDTSKLNFQTIKDKFKTNGK